MVSKPPRPSTPGSMRGGRHRGQPRGAAPKRGAAKLRRQASQPLVDPRAEQDATLRRLCEVVHQFGMVGGADYDSKETRLEQLLERVPGDGAVLVFAHPASAEAARAVVQRCCREEVCEPPLKRSRVKGPAPGKPAATVVVLGEDVGASDAQYIINYDLPSSGAEYLGRLASLRGAPVVEVVYSFFEERQLKSRGLQQIVALLKRARAAALAFPELGGQAKATELDSALEQLAPVEEEEEEEEEEGGEDCDCPHCMGRELAGTSYHGMVAAPSGGLSGVEVVRLPLRALNDIAAVAPLIAPRLPHVGTLICLHCLNHHTPWQGCEHLFRPPGMEGMLRVVLLLAEDCSWHDYPDSYTLCAGGVSWTDILDVESMDKADALIEKLVDHESELLGGCSERIVLMGTSQGGGQAMLRFLRSKRRLGGWIGSVCHVPTAPHTPRRRDPLLAENRPFVNLSSPVRLLAGECDSVFPSGLVLRDAERLRRIGGYEDVRVEVRRGLMHDGLKEGFEVEEGRDVPDLAFLQRELPAMLMAAPKSPEAC